MSADKNKKPFIEKLFIVICVLLLTSTIIGYSYVKEQDEKAETIYEAAKEDYNSSYSASFINSIIEIRESMSLKPKKFARAFLYGLYDEVKEVYDEAVDYYLLAIDAENADDEDKAFASFKISQIYLKQSDYENALIYINESIKLDDSKSYYYLYRSEYLLQLGNYVAALKDVKKYEQDNTLTTDQLSSVITIYLMVEDYDGAVEYINKAMTYEDVDQNNLLLYRCQTYILDEKYEEAYEDAQTYADNVGSNVQFVFAQNLQACELYQAAIEFYYSYFVENLETATMAEYEIAMECAYDGDDYDALLVFASTALEYMKSEEEISTCNKWEGIALMQLGYYEEAIDALDIYLDYNPEHFDIFYLRGLCYFILGEYNNAIEDYTIVINSNTMLEDALYNRALSYYQINEEDKCKDDLKLLIEIGTDDEMISAATELLATFDETTGA